MYLKKETTGILDVYSICDDTVSMVDGTDSPTVPLSSIKKRELKYFSREF
jgi:hypothetical protein